MKINKKSLLFGSVYLVYLISKSVYNYKFEISDFKSPDNDNKIIVQEFLFKSANNGFYNTIRNENATNFSCKGGAYSLGIGDKSESKVQKIVDAEWNENECECKIIVEMKNSELDTFYLNY